MNRELEMAKLACRALDEKKGKDIKVIDIHEVSVIADYFVIASASNQNQVQAMVDNVDETLGRAGFEAKQIEGTRNSSGRSCCAPPSSDWCSAATTDWSVRAPVPL